MQISSFHDHPVHQQSHVMTSPALDWVDGHILGNGDIGGVVWGTPESLNIGINKFDVWNLDHPYPEHGNQVTVAFPKILEEFRKGNPDFISAGKTLYAHAHQVFQQSAGILQIELLKGQPLKAMRQTLDFAKATSVFEAIPTTCGFMWGQDYQPVRCETIIHAARNLLCVRLSSGVARTIRFSLSNHLAQWPSAVAWMPYGQDGAVLTQQYHSSGSYAIGLRVMSAQKTLTIHPGAAMGEISFGAEAGDCFLFLTCESDRTAEGATEKATRRFATLTPAEWNGEWLASHLEWWKNFWMKSAVEYDDPEIARLWYMGLYALASSTRPHTAPPHLQGIWNHYTIPPWHTDYHFNVNVQECHWPAASSNHPECERALMESLTGLWRDHFRHFARENFESPGLMIPLCSDRLGRSLGGWAFDAEFSTTAWLAKHVIDHCEFTGDNRFLSEKAYPFLQEVADFYLHHIGRDENGKSMLELSHSPEQNWYRDDQSTYFIFGKNPAIDVAFVGEFLSGFLKLSECLGVADERVRQARAHLQNWPEIPTLNGHIIEYEIGYFLDGHRPGHLSHCHRHPSRLSAIFPCGQIGLHSAPERLEMGRRSLKEFQSYGDSDFSGWSYTFQACLAARLGMHQEWEGALRILIDDFSFKGMLTSHNSMRSQWGPCFKLRH
ncbi:glycoside hydrolase N-terminal domain-containing protein [Kamptonema cortianum]|nr:glycoside hydrolase N-terminal domain-containing protein [Oscillatoria laete-virens]MDK3156645.1 glycoside hydrolase N-terminal domain-containing protein [Kamptonema cortianum]MDL5050346.1 glycoside hydrolase N-terminal domain-containing protein [Oscillatoria amoena NRMC-F 0135]MDL5053383.1 glycoside hydrolase N-terminal domain-containing protein [Oscillatoria laete-virens NRMC-F 0139]